MDTWQKMRNEIEKRYKNIGVQTEWSPFVTGNNVVAAVEDENGKIWTGVNIETACGVVCVCAERVAECEILMDWETRETINLKDLLPYWWDEERFKNK